MEALIGFLGEDYVLIAADATANRSIVQFKDTEDKIYHVENNKVIAGAGEVGDRVQFCEYIQRNSILYALREDISLTPSAFAHYARAELATALRHNPYQVNLLLGGFDSSASAEHKDGSPALFFMDYLAALHACDKAAHGYASHFVLGILDRYWKPHMTQQEGKDLLRRCLNELKTRFLIKLPSFIVKVVDKSGIHQEAVQV